MRHRPEPTADEQLESALQFSIDHSRRRDAAEIVQRHQRARFMLATGECDLKFPPEILGVRMAEQIIRARLGIRRYIKRLGAADTGQRAGGDISHGISAGFAGGDADRRQAPHERGGVFDVDEVKLNILPRGDVADRVGILFGQLRKHDHLRWDQPAERDFNPHHPGRIPFGLRSLGQAGLGILEFLNGQAVAPPPVVIALPIGSAPQARLGEYFFVQLPRLAQENLRLERIDLLGQIRRHYPRQLIFPCFRGHKTHIVVGRRDHGKYIARRLRRETLEPRQTPFWQTELCRRGALPRRKRRAIYA